MATIFDPLTWDYEWSYDVERTLLASRGVELVIPADSVDSDNLTRRADVVISSSLIPIDESVLARFENCVGIVCYSSGLDAVDVDAAARAGIEVRNIEANYLEVADHAMALLLTLRRLILPMTTATENGKWDLREFPEIWSIPRLSGQTLGIVGVGRVGRQVGVRGRAFGMDTIANYHNPPPFEDPDLLHFDLDELFRRSDAVVLCASLKPDSVGMIDRDVLAGARPGSVLINVARGKLIDEGALVKALDSGLLAGAALDVRVSEPPDDRDPLSGRANVIQTPHMAGASAGAERDLHEGAAARVIELLKLSGRL